MKLQLISIVASLEVSEVSEELFIMDIWFFIFRVIFLFLGKVEFSHHSIKVCEVKNITRWMINFSNELLQTHYIFQRFLEYSSGSRQWKIKILQYRLKQRLWHFCQRAPSKTFSNYNKVKISQMMFKSEMKKSSI